MILKKYIEFLHFGITVRYYVNNNRFSIYMVDISSIDLVLYIVARYFINRVF